VLLTRHQTEAGARWALDGRFLPDGLTLGFLLGLERSSALELLRSLPLETDAEGPLLPPIESEQEVWASGVTYLRSRNARKAESSSGDVYDKVYDAQRPELFFKALGWRVAGDGGAVGIRADSVWNVPEPELTLVVNRRGEILGFTAGNDMSSREIEGENPLYLPQAKVYDRSCSLGPGILLLAVAELDDIPISVRISRGGAQVFSGTTTTSRMKRSPEELVSYLFRSLRFPRGAFLMTGTGIVPPDEFTLRTGDEIEIRVASLRLANRVVEATGKAEADGMA
jgi:2-dehydro-3-deoxy-D-arabinonate dehydratase